MLLVITLLIVLIYLFFGYSVYRTIKLIDYQDRLFPAWLAWLFFLPLFGLIFQWLMLPFGLPKSVKAFMPDDKVALKKSSKLFWLGLAFVILNTLASFAIFFLIIPALILLFIYWWELPRLRALLNTVPEVEADSEPEQITEQTDAENPKQD